MKIDKLKYDYINDSFHPLWISNYQHTIDLEGETKRIFSIVWVYNMPPIASFPPPPDAYVVYGQGWSVRIPPNVASEYEVVKE